MAHSIIECHGVVQRLGDDGRRQLHMLPTSWSPCDEASHGVVYAQVKLVMVWCSPLVKRLLMV